MKRTSGKRSRSRAVPPRAAALVTAMALLVTAACGQKAGVYDSTAAPDPLNSPAGGGSFVVDTATGETVPISAVARGDVVASAQSQRTGEVGASRSVEVQGKRPRLGRAAPQIPLSATRTGVSDSTITIGVHAPLTGAAPVPARSVDEGKDLYFRWMALQGMKIHGRDVRVIMKNDNFDTSHAVAVCKELVEKEQVFFIFGFAGPDQMAACARYAASVGVPYVALSSHRHAVENLPGFLSFALTFADQTPYLARLLAREGGGTEKNGVVRSNSASSTVVSERMKTEMAKLGMEYDREILISKSEGPTGFSSVVTALKQAGIQNVVATLSPTHMISLIKAANTQGYHPRWIGAGLSATLNVVTKVACEGGANSSLHGALYFNYIPAYVDADAYDPDFRKAREQLVESSELRGDEFHWLGWAFNRVLAQGLDMVGRDLTRERLVDVLSRSRFDPPIFHPIDFRADGRFGGSDMYLLRADCTENPGRWETVRRSVRDL